MTQKPAPSNGLGVAGFIISLVGIFTMGLLCPLGLLLSFIALFRRPRGFAFAGCVVGFIGSVIPLLIFLIFGYAAFSCISFVSPVFGTQASIQQAKQKIDGYVLTHGGAVPTDAEGQSFIAGVNDGWGHPLHFRRVGIGYEIRSAGADGVFGTEDDGAEIFDAPIVPR